MLVAPAAPSRPGPRVHRHRHDHRHVRRRHDLGATFNAGGSSQTFTVNPTVVAEYPVPPGVQPFGYQGLGGLIVGPDGNFWFSAGTSYVGTMTPAGKPTLYPLPAAGPKESISGMTIGPDGNIWVIRNGTVFVVSPSGSVLSRKVVDFYGQFVSAVAGGAVWFFDDWSGSLYRMTPGGAVTTFPIGGPHDDGSVALGADHNLWVADGRLGAIARVTLDGSVTGTFPSGTSGLAGNIAAGPDGNVWYSSGPQRSSTIVSLASRRPER